MRESQRRDAVIRCASRRLLATSAAGGIDCLSIAVVDVLIEGGDIALDYVANLFVVEEPLQLPFSSSLGQHEVNRSPDKVKVGVGRPIYLFFIAKNAISDCPVRDTLGEPKNGCGARSVPWFARVHHYVRRNTKPRTQLHAQPTSEALGIVICEFREGRLSRKQTTARCTFRYKCANEIETTNHPILNGLNHHPSTLAGDSAAQPSISFAICSAADSCIVGITWLYTSSVTITDEWPSISLTTFGLTPASRANDAAV